MSDLAAFGIGIGIGLVMMIVLIIFLWDELKAELRRLFEEPNPIARLDRPHSPILPPDEAADATGDLPTLRSRRPTTRVAIAFNGLAASALFGVGLSTGQSIAAVAGGVGLVSAAGFALIARYHELRGR